jgi:long-subunit fatty acid transport protein
MSAKFVTVLDKIGDGIKWFFTNPVAKDIETTGISIAEIAFPAVTPLLTGIAKVLATAQGLATVNTTGDTTSQVTALVLADAQQLFTEYQQATGTTIETPQQQAIISALVALLNEIPGASNTTPVASTSSGASINSATQTSAPSVQTQIKTNELL